MSNSKTEIEVIQHKKRAIRKINNLFESYITSRDPNLLKKTDLLSYWFEEFVNYIYAEDSFQPQRLLSYKRGDIIRVNLGFRVGNEMGGLHYAVVIENKNAHSSGVITIIPLSSTDGKTVHDNNVDIGVELYSKAEAQRLRLLDDAKKGLTETTDLLNALRTAKNNSDDVNDALETITQKQSEIKKTLAIINRYDNELRRMKSGRMAVVNQITTISKQRIYTPKKSVDFLYNVSLSDTAMDKITKKLSERLLH